MVCSVVAWVDHLGQAAYLIPNSQRLWALGLMTLNLTERTYWICELNISFSN